jgi:hypothetical protein
LTLAFVIAQFHNVLDTWILQAGDVHLSLSKPRAFPEQDNQDWYPH